MRLAYADPPYPGMSKRLYGEHPDYAGEVDHVELLERLERDYDGWALSTSVRALPSVLRLCNVDVLVAAWVKPGSPPMGDGRHYEWEPVIHRSIRRPSPPVRLASTIGIPLFGFSGPAPAGHVIGEKPAAFTRWVLALLGARRDDEFDDLYPGSGAVQRAWDAWCTQTTIQMDAS